MLMKKKETDVLCEIYLRPRPNHDYVLKAINLNEEQTKWLHLHSLKIIYYEQTAAYMRMNSNFSRYVQIQT